MEALRIKVPRATLSLNFNEMTPIHPQEKLEGSKWRHVMPSGRDLGITLVAIKECKSGRW